LIYFFFLFHLQLHRRIEETKEASKTYNWGIATFGSLNNRPIKT
jgi:hypothetical protein